MKRTWVFDIECIKKKIELMQKKLGEECRYIEINDEVKREINKSDCNFLISNYSQKIKINNILHDRAIRVVGCSASVTEGLIDCIKRG